jgi:hypothetical protein
MSGGYNPSLVNTMIQEKMLGVIDEMSKRVDGCEQRLSVIEQYLGKLIDNHNILRNDTLQNINRLGGRIDKLTEQTKIAVGNLNNDVTATIQATKKFYDLWDKNDTRNVKKFDYMENDINALKGTW